MIRIAVTGSKGQVATSLIERAGDRALAIPMQDPSLRSLNLSTAAALAAYEVLRQRS